MTGALPLGVRRLRSDAYLFHCDGGEPSGEGEFDVGSVMESDVGAEVAPPLM